MDICNINECTGCTACLNICPKNAIKFVQNHEGFYYPEVDSAKCVECGICKKICPNNSFNFSNSIPDNCYAVMASDEMRENSSSGGVFSLLANFVLNKKGSVVGAAFDDNMNLHHVIINENSKLDQLKGSKYIQSYLGDVYKEIKKILNRGDWLLFTGTPCQVAGLYNYLGKNYDNLITADIICHGVPSQKVFDNYLKSEFPNQKVLNTNFRDKKNGWVCSYLTTTTTTTTTTRSLPDDDDTYLKAYFSNISLRKSCSDCKYTRLPRVGDFTIADFWGVPKEMDDKKGTSLVFINNEKAEKIFASLKDVIKKFKKYPTSLPVSIQPHLSVPLSEHPARNDFFNDIENLSIKDNLDKNLCSKKNIGLLNYHWENENFGAVLTSYALNKFLQDEGYNVQNINYIPSFPWIPFERENNYFDNFRKKHIPVTKCFHYGDDLTELNKSFSSFVVGSDQVWRPEFIHKDKDAYFFSFATPDKNIISYAASFGIDRLDLSEQEILDYKTRLSLFDAVGVREKSAIEICNKMQIQATQVIDPVFLLSENHWDKLAESGVCHTDYNDIVYYTINETLDKDIEKFIKQNKDKLNYSSIVNITWNTSIEEWLYRIKNCKLFITDSYHGVCFATIFNKNFICVNTNVKTSTRMESLFFDLGINNRLYSSFEQVDISKILSETINYQLVNQNIKKFVEDGIHFLITSLNNHTDKTEYKLKIIRNEFQRKYEFAIKNKTKIWIKRLKYKILSKITFGPKRKKYKQKRKNLCSQYKEIKDILKRGNNL